MTNRLLFVLLGAFVLLTSACEKDESPRPALEIPSAYEFTDTEFRNNASAELTLLQQFTDLVNVAKAGRTQGTTVSGQVLDNLFSTGDPSVESINTTYYAGRVNEFMTELAKASGSTYTPGEPTGEGGVYSGYLFDENGLEMEQLIDKGQFGSAFFNRAAELLTQDNLTQADIDGAIALFGAYPSFPNSNSTGVANADRLLAGYAARRDKNDGTGLYTAVRDNFIKLQAAIAAGDDYRPEQEEAIEAILLNWEKANAATVINYAHSVITKLSATNPSDADKASALHSYSEMVGFIHGYRTVPQEYKEITDTEIDQLLVLLNAPADGTPTSYLFVTDSFNQLPKITQLIEQLQAIYGFTDQEVEDFRRNWVSEQGR